ncbi:hypothetical protein FHR70_001241 [Microvirga lupini]|uniref:Uncharacterized protein n=1 Tax=Microvirga lupini TaxID=420324 RepID=A0A7W4YVU7_9HYPH|nr:hypothetical protein [Microvirga lupini]MBB3018201.1 hypothetical protein [Microvirga lupini]
MAKQLDQFRQLIEIKPDRTRRVFRGADLYRHRLPVLGDRHANPYFGHDTCLDSQSGHVAQNVEFNRAQPEWIFCTAKVVELCLR